VCNVIALERNWRHPVVLLKEKREAILLSIDMHIYYSVLRVYPQGPIAIVCAPSIDQGTWLPCPCLAVTELRFKAMSLSSLVVSLYIEEFCMLRTVNIFKLTRINQQLCTEFRRLYLRRHNPYTFQWTCHNLQGMQGVTGAKESWSVNSSYVHQTWSITKF
jgi:hypothetical protein